ncbi:EamA family transporter [Microbacterium sp. W1N]|uniref:EamA family transporter n=1 Tax=Microbacterium festucae TaxID=2977531 RepID=UPI0021C240DC|nr:EamA family transporter [Microbacterium festucae]MCT9820930.1 EamA family transporter [Microbacterium festucae]
MSALAIVLVLGAAVAHAAWNVLAHGSSRLGLPFLWCGALVSTLIWAVALPFTGGIGDDLAGFLLGVGVSAVLHVAYMLVLQRGYAAGSLSTVYAIARGTGPLLAVVAAIVLLGERPAPVALVGVVAVIVGVVGIGLVDRGGERPAGRRGLDPAIVFGLLTGVAIAAYTIWDAHALRAWQVSPVAFMVGCTALEVPLFSITLLVRRRHREVVAVARAAWRPLIAFGILSPLSYILVLTAITMAPVALVAPMRELSVVLVSLFGAFVLREPRPGARIAASVVVAGGIVLLAL